LAKNRAGDNPKIYEQGLPLRSERIDDAQQPQAHLKLILEYNRTCKWNTEEGREGFFRLPNEQVPGDQIVFVEDPGG
jgi:hypothetical protein